MSQGEERTAERMPEAVRVRVLSLAAEVLPDLAELPARLRKVAGFAPHRRARLGATPIAAALETSDDFRARVATQVAARLPVLAEAMAAGQAPEAADPVELAAYAWLSRDEGWEETYDAALAEVRAGPDPRMQEQLERLQGRLDAAEDALRDARAQHKTQVADLKADNTDLRRKLGEARASLRSETERTSAAAADAAEIRASAEAGLAAAEAENRRLRGELDELRKALTAARREARADRDETTLRARVLLDTLVDGVQGLRRELALPTVAGAPGERVEAELAAEGTRDPSSAGALGPASGPLLEQYLTMPRSRMIIDGYNVSKAAWPDLSLEAQRNRLLGALAPLTARTGAETTVVFDAASSTSRPVAHAPRGVKVLFSPAGVIADDVIRDLVAAEPAGRVVVVVSSDGEVARDVRRGGARSVAAEALLALLSG